MLRIATGAIDVEPKAVACKVNTFAIDEINPIFHRTPNELTLLDGASSLPHSHGLRIRDRVPPGSPRLRSSVKQRDEDRQCEKLLGIEFDRHFLHLLGGCPAELVGCFPAL